MATSWYDLHYDHINNTIGASLVAQWEKKKIQLTMQETQVQSLVQEDPTCRGTTKPLCHNY